ncbi:SET and MYND domain-containing protein 4 [Musca vetustissima]|uniref:SET and MYND domain-containing protein 4 n=1 Tax=Musca vetustissima TaxID=27455 RepID=UPI002AB6519A|nr:SET and MYND domain-containing protein 4 [Musca vetustissima]
MDSSLCSLFSSQSVFIRLEKYENEFETMRHLFELPPKLQRYCEDTSLQWIKLLEQNEDTEFSLKDDSERLEESQELRKQGNIFFNAKNNRNILGACRLYNDAIFAALDCKGCEEIALGFANRAMALQAFGYYGQAYDDCVCALKMGYPTAMRHKIIMRQAYCSVKLNDAEALKRHLLELEGMSLNDSFQKQFKEFQESLQKLEGADEKESPKVEQEETKSTRDSQEIIDTGTDLGRIMKAKKFIPKDQLIFRERAPAFTPVGDGRRICHQCAITGFIPYPCFNCRGRVVYCSLKCQNEHENIHRYECAGYRFQLFANAGIAHLALRTILDDGLFTIVDELKSKTTDAEIWQSLTKGGDIYENSLKLYAESLRMISNLDIMTIMDIKWFALISYLLVVYLKHYTKFFDELKEHNSKCNWELLVGTLILRHVGQLISNAHMLTTIISKPLYFTKTEFYLLNDRIWLKPGHLKRGYLHTFSNYEDVAAINLPYLSICNHSCVQSFQPKFSGRYISTFALRDLRPGDEITNCYDLDYRKVKREARQQRLKSTYNFDCKCENCSQPNEDADFNQYHRYRCDNKDCREIFIPIIPQRRSLNWWQNTDEGSVNDITIFCTKCGCEQRLDWYHEIKGLLDKVRQSGTRRRLYQIFKSLENTFIGLNDVRVYVALKFCAEWFKLPYFGVPLHDQDYTELIDMTKYLLACTKHQSSVNSIEYVAEMIYLWDMAAMGKYKLTATEKEETLFALSIISDQTKEIFLNYYNDYIKKDDI